MGKSAGQTVRFYLATHNSLDQVVDLFRELGYTAAPQRIDAATLGLGHYPANRMLREGPNRRTGYAVFVTEVSTWPRSFVPLGRALREHLHDNPLAVVGMPGTSGRWERFVLLRPRVVQASSGWSYRVAKLEVWVDAPTRHDADVVDALRWRPPTSEMASRIDAAFDVEAVTKKFFLGLRRHFDHLEARTETLGEASPATLHGIRTAGGTKRVAIRLMSQVLFCWFLQRKGLLAGDRDFLLTRWRRHRGLFYATELEPLFYETLAVPVAQRIPGHPGVEVPFLNGGLFTRQYGAAPLPLPDEVFDEDQGLLGYLAGWTFTATEETPDEVDVAVDPELLGRIFEHLISDEEQQRHGVVYTPRPVVQFMCREALMLHLNEPLGWSSVWRRRLLTEDAVFVEYAEAFGAAAALEAADRLDDALAAVSVLDPAVGSGAFLLGMLAEIVRLRTLASEVRNGRLPTPSTIRNWKLRTIEHSLCGVDIEPLAVELCRLRLWLALMTDWSPGEPIDPLPNLEHRTLAADALTDYVDGFALQDTRTTHALTRWTEDSARDVEPLRAQYFAESDPTAKKALQTTLTQAEATVITGLLDDATTEAGNRPAAERERARQYLDTLRRAFLSPDRVFPVFVPGFHAPHVWTRGGWDIVILNPPYLGRKQVAQKVKAGEIDAARHRDWVKHHGESTDLMLLFAQRARELVRPGGVCALIGQDSLFTSSDGEALRHRLLHEDTVHVVARTRCFEGQAINGGVVIWRRGGPGDTRPSIRWVEGYKRDPRDFAAASNAMEPDDVQPMAAGQMEVWDVPYANYTVVPSRPLFRPAPAAQRVLQTFADLEPDWMRGPERFRQLSATQHLQRTVRNLHETGWFTSLTPGAFIPLGFCIEGGQGLATADDKRFLAAVEGMPEADECLVHQQRLMEVIRQHADLRTLFDHADGDEGERLIALWEPLENDRRLRWPRLLRVAPPSLIRQAHLTEAERRDGIKSGPYFVPFEKGDQSDEDEAGHALGAKWWRDNPIVIDWSTSAVGLLRSRASQTTSHRKPYFRNEELWGQGGVTWNSVARYFRARLVPEGAIFGHMAPTIRPRVPWLNAWSLLALLNSQPIEYVLRTFLGSLMHFEIGDIRRIPVPVLAQEQVHQLSELGRAAVQAVQQGDRSHQVTIENAINDLVRQLYGIPAEEELWVAR